MIDVSMRDEDMVDVQDLARRQGGNIADVEQDRTVRELGLDVQRRISGSPVDQRVLLVCG
jgi:hypothetical protein